MIDQLLPLESNYRYESTYSFQREDIMKQWLWKLFVHFFPDEEDLTEMDLVLVEPVDVDPMFI